VLEVGPEEHVAFAHEGNRARRTEKIVTVDLRRNGVPRRKDMNHAAVWNARGGKHVPSDQPPDDHFEKRWY